MTDNLYLNGSYMPLERGCVPVEDRGFQFGDGVYEVVRVYDGRPFRLEKHLARLERSLTGVEIPLPETLPGIEQICLRVLGPLRDAIIYLQVTRGVSQRRHAFPNDARPTFLAYAREVAPGPLDTSLTLHSIPDERWGRCDLKTTSLIANVLGKQTAIRAGCSEGLFVRRDGTVTEGTSSNAFMVKASAVVTHPATNRILNGITREAILELTRELGIAAAERPFTLEEAVAADEFFMTGTLTEVGHVISINGIPIGSGEPGPVVRRLRTAFATLVRSGTPKAVDRP